MQSKQTEATSATRKQPTGHLARSGESKGLSRQDAGAPGGRRFLVGLKRLGQLSAHGFRMGRESIFAASRR